MRQPPQEPRQAPQEPHEAALRPQVPATAADDPQLAELLSLWPGLPAGGKAGLVKAARRMAAGQEAKP